MQEFNGLINITKAHFQLYMNKTKIRILVSGITYNTISNYKPDAWHLDCFTSIENLVDINEYLITIKYF